MKHIKSFTLFNNYVDLIFNTGELLKISFNEYSGKAYYRFKVQTISGVKHPGIYLGVDSTGTEYIAHNHYHFGKPVITTLDEFRKGQQIFLYEEFATNPSLLIIEIALNGVLRGERYEAVTFNCQSYVHEAISNKRTSPTIKNIFLGTVAFALLAATIRTR